MALSDVVRVEFGQVVLEALLNEFVDEAPYRYRYFVHHSY